MLFRSTQILSSEAVVAYLHRDLANNPSDSRDTNPRTVQITLTTEEKVVNVDVNETVQEIDTAVKEAYSNWAKFYIADCTHSSWNRKKIRAGDLPPQCLPLTPEVHIFCPHDPSWLDARPRPLQVEAGIAAADEALTKATSDKLATRRAVSRAITREKRKDTLQEPQGYTIAKRNSPVAKAREMPSAVATLIHDVRCVSCCLSCLLLCA